MAPLCSVRRALGKAETPTIGCFTRPTTDPIGVNFDALIDALNVYVGRHVARVWGKPARLRVSKSFVRGAWGIVFLNNADEDRRYHRSELRKRPGVRRRCNPVEIARREKRVGQ